MMSNRTSLTGDNCRKLAAPIRFKGPVLPPVASSASPYKGRQTGVAETDPGVLIKRTGRNVVSRVPDSGRQNSRRWRGLGGRCRSPGFAGGLDAVSDSLAALERIGGAPTAHAAASQGDREGTGQLGSATATTDLAHTVQTHRHALGTNAGKTAAFRIGPRYCQSQDGQAERWPEGLHTRDAKAPSALSDQSSRRRERARSEGGRGSLPGDGHPPAGGG
jgi:hypothetical protein